MNYPAILRTLGMVQGLCAGAFIAPVAVALFYGEYDSVRDYVFTAALVAAFALLLILAAPKASRRSRATDGLALAMLWWISSPLLFCLPFLFASQTFDWPLALHEAASCLTTAGHSVIEIKGGEWPLSLIAYRGVLHLFGAIAFMTIAISVFAAVNIGGPGVHRSELFAASDEDFINSARRVARTASLITLAGLGIFGIAFLLIGESPAAAMSLASSIVSTGIVDPDPEAPISAAARLIAIPGLLLAALGLSPFIVSRPDLRSGAFGDPETLLLLGLTAVFAVLAIAYGAPLIDGVFWSVSSISTSGIGGADIHGYSTPLALVVAPALIGGSVLSSAGGIKLARLSILLRRTGQEFARLGYPKSIVALSFRGRPLAESAIIGVWVYVAANVFVLFLAALWLTFLGWSFESAVSGASGFLMNAGALVDSASLEYTNFLNIGAVLLLIIGRLEILALLPALNPSFWRS